MLEGVPVLDARAILYLVLFKDMKFLLTSGQFLEKCITKKLSGMHRRVPGEMGLPRDNGLVPKESGLKVWRTKIVSSSMSRVNQLIPAKPSGVRLYSL